MATTEPIRCIAPVTRTVVGPCGEPIHRVNAGADLPPYWAHDHAQPHLAQPPDSGQPKPEPQVRRVVGG